MAANEDMSTMMQHMAASVNSSNPFWECPQTRISLCSQDCATKEGVSYGGGEWLQCVNDHVAAVWPDANDRCLSKMSKFVQCMTASSNGCNCRQREDRCGPMWQCNYGSGIHMDSCEVLCVYAVKWFG